jgi:hypothetical protein
MEDPTGHIGELDGPADLVVVDFHRVALAAAAVVSAEGGHPAGGKSGFR